MGEAMHSWKVGRRVSVVLLLLFVNVPVAGAGGTAGHLGRVQASPGATVAREPRRPQAFLLTAYNPPYAWHGPPYEDSAFLYYKNAGFDTLNWVRDEDALMDKVHQWGFRYFLDIRSLFPELDPNGVDYLQGVQYPEAGDEVANVAPEPVTEEMLHEVDRVVQKYRDDPNLIGYWICDEPYPAAYPNIATVVRRIRQEDPNPSHGCLINIGDDEYTTDENVEDFLNTTGVGVLCYDRYNFFNGYDRNDLYFERLVMMRRHALKHHIPFYNIVQAVGTNGTSVSWDSAGDGEHLDWRTPSPAEHRWLAYSSMAYGVHGIVWFHWDAADWGVVENPDRDVIYPSLQSINAEIRSLGPVLFHLTTTHVEHTDTSAYDTDGGESVVRRVSDGVALVVGSFKDEEGRQRYFMLMNKDFSNAVETEVTMRYRLHSLEVFNVNTSEWEAVAFENEADGGSFTVDLRAGGGKLFRFEGTLAADARGGTSGRTAPDPS